MNMEREALITALIAGAENNPSKVQLEDEDFVIDPEGEWFKDHGHYNTVTFLRAMDMASMPIMYTFDPFTDQKTRNRLKVIWDMEHELAKSKTDQRIAQLVGYRLVTSLKYRMIRYTTKRADEIFATQNERP